MYAKIVATTNLYIRMQIGENVDGSSKTNFQTPYVLNNLLCMDMKVSIVDAGERNGMRRQTMDSDFDPLDGIESCNWWLYLVLLAILIVLFVSCKPC